MEGQEYLKGWNDFEIYATTKKDLIMSVWDNTKQKEPITHICKKGNRVRILMISRFGDVGVTDNLKDVRGYRIRGLDADLDLTDYEFIELNR